MARPLTGNTRTTNLAAPPAVQAAILHPLLHHPRKPLLRNTSLNKTVQNQVIQAAQAAAANLTPTPALLRLLPHRPLQGNTRNHTTNTPLKCCYD